MGEPWWIVLGVGGSIASLLGLAVAFVQYIHNQEAQRLLRQVQRTKNITIWSNIANVLQAYESIEDARDLLHSGAGAPADLLLAKINSVRRSLVAHYLELLKEAVLDEPVFTLETVEKWRASGRLENEWRAKQAMKFVQTADLTVRQ